MELYKLLSLSQFAWDKVIPHEQGLEPVANLIG